MRSRDFVYWLQGFFELAGCVNEEVALTPEQAAIIQRHLNMVFIHEIDPSMGDEEQQELLDAAHNSKRLRSIFAGDRLMC